MRPIATKYEDIADDLRQQIADETLAPGSRLPSIAQLMERYDAAERTVLDATRLLLIEGVISSKVGAGYTVRERPEVMRLARSWYRDNAGKGSPWRADMADQGHDGSWTSQSKSTPATAAVAERLHIEPGARTMRTEYVFTVDGKPTYLSASWEPMGITMGTEILLPEDGEFAGRGVVDRFAAIGITVTEVREELIPRTLTGAEAEKLGLNAGMAILVIERTYYAGKTPVETADIVLPPHVRPVYRIPVGGDAP